ncbi:SWI/SNF-related matrix-associated actin-dependent regulator of chromatin subfamily D member 3 isoform X6 [Gopherus flavomarginatus]|uniref:SWI/SNF-related matrix-associated actin-dependent regulator of chromatin subfamily D member 3 isoform X6 n=1 Tax=Gopherus flavomarginatus TaxID=286002 RepID=UPI0021CBC3D8|nr:SWI/SNF-related matrix-associated actin-dependent regulator of chromatin subfamily D member 3 isoform X6 [Gopherus flavomarginatus]
MYPDTRFKPAVYSITATRLNQELCNYSPWDAIRCSNAPSGGSNGSPRLTICWKPLSAPWNAPNSDGTNTKTHSTSAGTATAGATAGATAAASNSDPNPEQKRKLRLYISNTFNPAKSDADDSDGSIASWELRVEGKLLDDLSKQKRKFSSFFKSLVIELDKDLYGPDNHLVEWHRTPTTQETDGFQVKRPGDVSVRCTLLLMLDYQPPQFKLDPRLARLLGIHTQTRSAIIQALWQYIKTNKLQDSHDKEYINCDKYFQQIFDCPRLKFSEIPQRLTNLLLPPDPIVINHIISVDPNDQKKTACYDIDVEVEDPLKGQMSSFLLSTANQQEITALDNKIHETIESINQLKIQRDFMLSFSKDPKGYIQDLLRSQSRDLKVMTDVVGNPEEERRAEFYHEPWSQEAVSRYFYCKIQQRRQELEQSLGVRNT